jgi:hypothetical protein
MTEAMVSNICGTVIILACVIGIVWIFVTILKN